MSELESDVKQLQDELEKQQVHLREADREKTRAVQELSEQNQRLLDQLSRVSQLGGTAGHGTGSQLCCHPPPGQRSGKAPTSRETNSSASGHVTQVPC